MTQTDLSADDIDILIPEVYVKGISWKDFKLYLESRGYVLVDAHEHSFRKNGIDYSYASIENLEKFAGIRLEDIQVQNDSNIQYLLLTLEQYLSVYKKSATDGYRVNKKEKKDNEKIIFTIGRLVYEKGIQHLLYAMPKIIQNYNDVKLIIAGKRTE